MAAEVRRPVIVVGVDGSQDSKEALRWAAGYARLAGGELHVVTAWQVPFTIYVSPSYTEADYARDAADTMHKAVIEALGPDPGIPVLTRLIQNRPGAALTQEAEHGALLVVGGHGTGELPGMHLGSVAAYCVHHAPCPVTVVCHRR